MKKLLALTILTGLPAVALAGDSAVSVGVFGGGMWSDTLEVIGSSYTIVPKVGYWTSPSLGVELDFDIYSYGEDDE